MKMRKILSVQVGQPKTVEFKGRMVTTSIFKSAVRGPVAVNNLGITGDSQSDLTVHGGVLKAVYAYPAEHYDWWRDQYPQFDYEYGAFGENLTIFGLVEEELNVGDLLKMGSVVFRVTQPRFPCYKLGIKFNNPKMTAFFHFSKKSGFYLEVLEEGILQANDEIVLVSKQEGKTIADLVEKQITRS
ncbi:MAG: MOSC domain-containing protein [Reichenbachiella sp.]|uniref:MOSC domain-containing protein n=1 Tax=Reichenbachiella sp. TaxID=2184521 RepID=UPI0032995A21